MGRPPKNNMKGEPRGPELDDAELEERDGESTEGDESPWDDELSAWAEGEEYEGTSLRIAIYRQATRGAPREKVWEYEDEVVSSHEIGLRFGGGRYSVFARIIREGRILKRIRRHFTLSETYTEEMRKRAPQAPQGAAMGGMRPMSFEDMARGVAAMVAAVMPAIAALRDAFAPPDKFGNTAEANKLIQAIVADSARAQISFAKEMRAEIQQMGKPMQPAQTQEEEPSIDEFKQYMIMALREYGPSLLEAAGLKLKAALGFIKRDEVFVALSQNPKTMEKVFDGIMKDPELNESDREMVGKVLEKLAANGLGFNVRRPATAGGR